jgi:CDP-2,3-bis-(O-geranylgeranyl)-sn-glycerol synthase
VPPSQYDIVDAVALLLLIASQVTPVLLAWVMGPRWAAPIDGGRRLGDQYELFGAHKTWRGFIGGTLATAFVGSVVGIGCVLGALFGFLALTGDLGSSFAKRRLGRAPGANVPGLDQLPEALLPLLSLYQPLGLDPVSLIGTAMVFLILNLLFGPPLNAV